MSRQQHCLVYSIDAILGLTSAGQRSSSATIGRRKYHGPNDASELQPNAATFQKAPSGKPIIGLLAPNSRSVQCHRKALSTLSQKSATVAENGETTAKFGDCRTFLRQSHFCVTVSLFCDKLSHFPATVWTGFRKVVIITVIVVDVVKVHTNAIFL